MYSKGINYYGNLGLPKSEKEEFGEVEFFRNIEIQQIFPTNSHTLVLTSYLFFTKFLEDQKVYGFGNNKNGQISGSKSNMFSTPQEIQLTKNGKIIKVCCDDCCSIFLYEDGSIYIMGSSLYLHKRIKKFQKPTKLDTFKGMKVYDIFPFYYGKGYTATDQGLFISSQKLDPVELNMFRGHTVKKIFQEYDYSIIQTDKGLYSKGGNRNGEIGYGDFQRSNDFKQVEQLKSDEVEYFSSGSDHCIVLTSRKFDLTFRNRKIVLIWR